MAGGDDADAEDAEADAGRMRTIVVAESGLVGRGIVQEKAGRSDIGPPRPRWKLKKTSIDFEDLRSLRIWNSGGLPIMSSYD